MAVPSAFQDGLLRFIALGAVLLAGLLASIICGIMGTLVVANRIVFLSGGIAHAAYGGIGLAFYFNWPYLLGTAGFTAGLAITRLEHNGLRPGEPPKHMLAAMALLSFVCIFLGVYPKPALDRIEPSVAGVLERIEDATDYKVPEFGMTEDLAERGGE